MIIRLNKKSLTKVSLIIIFFTFLIVDLYIFLTWENQVMAVGLNASYDKYRNITITENSANDLYDYPVVLTCSQALDTSCPVDISIILYNATGDIIDFGFQDDGDTSFESGENITFRVNLASSGDTNVSIYYSNNTPVALYNSSYGDIRWNVYFHNSASLPSSLTNYTYDTGSASVTSNEIVLNASDEDDIAEIYNNDSIEHYDFEMIWNLSVNNNIWLIDFNDTVPRDDASAGDYYQIVNYETHISKIQYYEPDGTAHYLSAASTDTYYCFKANKTSQNITFWNGTDCSGEGTWSSTPIDTYFINDAIEYITIGDWTRGAWEGGRTVNISTLKIRKHTLPEPSISAGEEEPPTTTTTSTTTTTTVSPISYRNVGSNPVDVLENQEVILHAEWNATNLNHTWIETNETYYPEGTWQIPYYHDLSNKITVNLTAGSGKASHLYDNHVVHNGTHFFVYYTGYDGSGIPGDSQCRWPTFLAISEDGENFIENDWNSYGIGLVFVCNTTTGAFDRTQTHDVDVYKWNSTHWKMYYTGTATNGIGIAWSQNLTGWDRDHAQVVLAPSSGWEANSVAYPSVYYNETSGVEWMVYGGQAGGADEWEIGIANSTDGGYTWTKFSGNPIITVGSEYYNNYHNLQPRLIVLGSKAYMHWNCGNSTGHQHVCLATAELPNWFNWTLHSDNPIIAPSGTDSNSLRSSDCGTLSPIKINTTWYGFFTADNQTATPGSERYVLVANITTTWQNITSDYDSIKNMNNAVDWTWSNFTWNFSTVIDENKKGWKLEDNTTIGFKFYANDTTGNENVTSINIFTITETTSTSTTTTTTTIPVNYITRNDSSISNSSSEAVNITVWCDNPTDMKYLYRNGSLILMQNGSTSQIDNITTGEQWTIGDYILYGNSSQNETTETISFSVTESTTTSTTTSTTSSSTTSTATTSTSTTSTITVDTYTINWFNDSSTAKNLTFTSNSTEYVNMPKYARVIYAGLNASGFLSWSDWDDTEDAANSVGNCHPSYPCSRGYDEDWSGGGVAETCTNAKDECVVSWYENYTLPSYNESIEKIRYYGQFALEQNSSVYISLYNYTTDSWTLIYNRTNVSTFTDAFNPDVNVSYENFVVSGNPLWQNVTIDDKSDKYNIYYESEIKWETYPYDSSLDAGDDGDYDWSFSGELNETNSPQRTSDVSSEFNDYLWTCTPVSSNCTVPLVFHSDSAGIIQADDLNVTYWHGYNYNTSHDDSVYETESTTFRLWVQNNTVIGNVSLIWNSTKYSPTTSSDSANTTNHTRTLSIPSVVANENVSFYWNFSVGGTTVNTDTEYQYITNINFTDCSGGGTKIYDFWFFDEKNLSHVNASMDVTFNIWYSDGTQINKSFAFRDDKNYSVCIYPEWTENLTVDAHMDYWFTGYPHRSYYYYHAVILNQSVNQSLYMLEDSPSDRITFTIQDAEGNLEQDVYVKILRYYVDTNTFRTVAIGKSDYLGQFITYLEMYDVWYKFILEQSGSVIQSIDSMKIASTDITLMVEAAGQVEWFKYYDMISYSCSYSNVTENLVCSATDTSGYANVFCLNVTELAPNNETTLCEVCEESSAVTLSCNVGNATDRTIHYVLSAYLVMSPGDWVTVFSGLLQHGLIMSSVFGLSGLFMSMLISGSSAFTALWKPGVAIIILIVGLGILSVFGLFTIGWGTLISIAVAGAIIIYRLRK